MLEELIFWLSFLKATIFWQTDFFSALWDKVNSIYNSDIPFLCTNLFGIPKFCETMNGSSWNLSILWDKKNSMRKKTPHLLSIIFSTLEIYWHLEAFPHEDFSAVWDKEFSTEKRDTSPHLLPIKFYPRRKISESPKGPLTKFLCPLKKIFSTKPWCPSLLCMKIFDNRLFWKRIFSALWDKKINGE